MQVEIMEKFLETLNRQMVKEERNVILFLENATVRIPLHWLILVCNLSMLESFKVLNQSIERS